MAIPSRFLEEIPRHCVHRSERLDALPAHHTSASTSTSASPSPSTSTSTITSSLASNVSEISHQQHHHQKLQPAQRVEHFQQENERPDSPNTGTKNVTASKKATIPRQQQSTLDNLLPQHAARAGRLEKAAHRPIGSGPLRQGPPAATIATTGNAKLNTVGSNARRQADQDSGGNGRPTRQRTVRRSRVGT